MRDALGALGPVDGINPELSNLTLSITTLRKGDIVMVSSDGLTDNFDPNVCRFTVNCNVEPSKPKRTSTSRPTKGTPSHSVEEHKVHASKPVKIIENPQKPPVKPPRRSKHRDDSSRSSAENSVKSVTMSEKSSSQSVESVTETQNIDNTSSELSNAEKLVEGSVSNIEQGSSASVDEKALQKPQDTSTNEVSDTAGSKPEVDYENPLVQQFIRENSVEDTPKVGKSKSALQCSLFLST